MRAATLLLTTALLLGCARDQQPLRVFAAAGLHAAANDLARVFAAQHDLEVSVHSAGTQALAQQLRAGARADLFLSADVTWMHAMVGAGLVDEESVRPFTTTRVVLVAHEESGFSLRAPRDLPDLRFAKLSTGFPDVVPIGRYTRRALDRIVLPTGETVWRNIQPRLAPMPDVRHALSLVERDPQIIGAVYKSEALASELVQELMPLDALATFWAGRVSNSKNKPQVDALLNFLQSERAAATLHTYGFEPPRVDTVEVP